MARRWIVLRERIHQRWGGDLRRRYILSAVAARRDAVDLGTWAPDEVRRALRPGRLPWGRARPLVVAATPLAPEAIRAVTRAAVPFAVDYHDDVIKQNDVLGVAPDQRWLAAAIERKRLNLEAFRWHIVPSTALADLAGLELSRTIVAGNGTDPDIIRPTAWPSRPAIGMISGAAPHRGIEQLIDATRLMRLEVPELRLLLWLAATGARSAEYLDDLVRRTRQDHWIEFGSAPYEQIGEQLGRAMIHCIPNPPAEYWDAVSPIKLFDAMAAARPVVVTPRRAIREVVETHAVGVVTQGERPEDIADSALRLLHDEALAMRLGANGRSAATTSYRWSSIATALEARLVMLSAGS